MIPRRRGESAATYVKRALIAHGEVKAHEMAEAKTTDNIPDPVAPAEVEQAIANLRRERWLIDLKGTDRAGWRTYTVRDIPKATRQRRAVREALTEAQLAEARLWACAACGSHPAEVPRTLLGGLGEGRCVNCDKRKALFRR